MSVSGDAILDPPLVGSNALVLSDSGRDASPPVHVDAKLFFQSFDFYINRTGSSGNLNAPAYIIIVVIHKLYLSRVMHASLNPPLVPGW